jgi:hypothetical protein
MRSLTRPPATYKAIHYGIADVLQAARTQAARSVNALMTASYWETGRRIVEAEQQGKRRAGYGEQLIERLSIDLTAQFGRGFGVVNLSQMRKFYELWPIFQTVSEKYKAKSLLLCQLVIAPLARISTALLCLCAFGRLSGADKTW